MATQNMPNSIRSGKLSLRLRMSYSKTALLPLLTLPLLLSACASCPQVQVKPPPPAADLMSRQQPSFVKNLEKALSEKPSVPTK